MFLALEILSIPLYVLAAFDRRRLSSQEAGIKYFVLGAFSSAIFLYGVALIYGATGTTSLTGSPTFLAQNTLFEQGTLLAGFALLLVGLGFKVAAVPFHMWTPDVYQGAPTPVTAFMAVGHEGRRRSPRCCGSSAWRSRCTATDWRPIVWVLAVLSLVVGSIAAVVQTDVKRMLAYSSIAHAGYILMGVRRRPRRAGREAALFYLFVYTFMSIGVVRRGHCSPLQRRRRPLDRRLPGPGVPAPGARRRCSFFFVLAQAGIPLTGGFIAKLEVFAAAARGRASTCSLVIGAWRGRRRVLLPAGRARRGRLRPKTRAPKTRSAVAGSVADGQGAVATITSARRVDVATGVVLFVAATMTLVLGLVPGEFINWASHAGFLL